jgi:hypothetical protein
MLALIKTTFLLLCVSKVLMQVFLGPGENKPRYGLLLSILIVIARDTQTRAKLKKINKKSPPGRAKLTKYEM